MAISISDGDKMSLQARFDQVKNALANGLEKSEWKR